MRIRLRRSGVDNRYIAEQKALKLKVIEKLRERDLAWRRRVTKAASGNLPVSLRR
jgi:hypothetical protein